MELSDLVAEAGRRWRIDTTGWEPLVDGADATVRLPAAGAALHVSRTDVGVARVAGIQTARRRLDEEGVPVPELLRSANGATWEQVGDRLLEVDRWVDHDGRMNTWSRLRTGAGLLARVHNAWSDLELPAADACGWANWISPTTVVADCDRAARRLHDWGLGELAERVTDLAVRTADVGPLPEQIVHGDFWDNNVLVRGEDLIAVIDFGFLGRRPRIDDLALMLHFADEQPYFEGSPPRESATRIAELTPLVRAYSDRLAVPLSDAEWAALPVALARQPLWGFGRWVATLPDSQARRQAHDTAPAVTRAGEVLAELGRWREAFATVT